MQLKNESKDIENVNRQYSQDMLTNLIKIWQIQVHIRYFFLSDNKPTIDKLF